MFFIASYNWRYHQQEHKPRKKNKKKTPTASGRGDGNRSGSTRRSGSSTTPMSWGFTVCLPWRNLQKSASRRWKYLDSRKSWIIRLGWIQKMVMVAQVPLFCGVGEYTLPFRPILSDRTKDTKTTFCGLNKIFLTSKNHISPPSSQPPQLLLWMTERLFGLPALSSQKNHTQWWGHHCQGEKFCEGVRCQSSQSDDCWCSLLGTNISPPKGTFEDAFPFPTLGDMLVPCTVTTMGFDDDTHVKIKHPILKISSRVHYIAPWCKRRWKIMKRHLKFAKGSLEVLPLLIIFCRKKVDSTSFCGESMPNLF